MEGEMMGALTSLFNRVVILEDTCKVQALGMKRKHDDQDDHDHHEGDKRARVEQTSTSTGVGHTEEISKDVTAKESIGVGGGVQEEEEEEESKMQMVMFTSPVAHPTPLNIEYPVDIHYEEPKVEKPKVAEIRGIEEKSEEGEKVIEVEKVAEVFTRVCPDK